MQHTRIYIALRLSLLGLALNLTIITQRASFAVFKLVFYAINFLCTHLIFTKVTQTERVACLHVKGKGSNLLRRGNCVFLSGLFFSDSFKLTVYTLHFVLCFFGL